MSIVPTVPTVPIVQTVRHCGIAALRHCGKRVDIIS
jgi:hypothetical protein